MEDKDEDEVNIFGQLESEEEEEAAPVQRRPNKERNHLLGHKKLMADYFNANSTYDNQDFERRFQMEKWIFLRIVADLEAACPYFVQKAVSQLIFSLFSNRDPNNCLSGLHREDRAVQLPEGDCRALTTCVWMCSRFN